MRSYQQFRQALLEADAPEPQFVRDVVTGRRARVLSKVDPLGLLKVQFDNGEVRKVAISQVRFEKPQADKGQ